MSTITQIYICVKNDTYIFSGFCNHERNEKVSRSDIKIKQVPRFIFGASVFVLEYIRPGLTSVRYV